MPPHRISCEHWYTKPYRNYTNVNVLEECETTISSVIYSQWTKRLWRNLRWCEVSFRVETAFVNVVNLWNRESRPRKKTSLTEKAQYIEIARSEKLKIWVFVWRARRSIFLWSVMETSNTRLQYCLVCGGEGQGRTPPSTHTRWGTNTHGKAHIYVIWLEHYWSTDGQADHFFSRGLATLELAMSVGWSVGRSVGLWETKTKSEHFLAIPHLPTRPRLGGVYTALFPIRK